MVTVTMMMMINKLSNRDYSAGWRCSESLHRDGSTNEAAAMIDGDSDDDAAGMGRRVFAPKHQR